MATTQYGINEAVKIADGRIGATRMASGLDGRAKQLLELILEVAFSEISRLDQLDDQDLVNIAQSDVFLEQVSKHLNKDRGKFRVAGDVVPGLTIFHLFSDPDAVDKLVSASFTGRFLGIRPILDKD